MIPYVMRNKRSLLSSCLMLLIIPLLYSAYWLFFQSRTDSIATVHISVGVVLFAFAVWHIFQHLPSLRKYIADSPSKLLPVTIISVGLLVGIVSWLPPFNEILNYGGNARYENKDISQLYIPLEEGASRNYQVDNLNQQASGPEIKLTARIGTSFGDDMALVMWIEDLQGNYLQTLYSTRRFGKGFMTNPLNRSENIHRQEAVPHWLHARAKALGTDITYAIPSLENPLVDGITAATPRTNFIVNSKLNNADLRQFVVKVEANQSYDWNEHYSRDRFPDDPVYSGSGQVGQPAIVYRTEIDLDSPQDFYILTALGHSHRSGQNGDIDPDMTGITTAILDFHRLIVEMPEFTAKESN
ncbi:hypothetical protein [Enterovibrio coralii]|uniref:DUF4405 domain-containing protein n=1 Tax=Enterovibrio coralii TaxID=294935 RepID=A0A135ICG5_9GAMM|nr:hypothetical protein [Enterovibrio coralii]KXF83161.1 hypothetical protein ATN88_05525 [Enterovibrio coralii]